MSRYLLIFSGLLSWWLLCWFGAAAYTETRIEAALERRGLLADHVAADLAVGFTRIVAVREGMPRVLAREPIVRDALHRLGFDDRPSRLGYEERKHRWSADPSMKELNGFLRRVADDLGLDTVRVLNPAGECIAAANVDTAENPVGTSYADREYVPLARNGKRSHIVNIGRVWRVPRLTFVEPVFVKGRFAGMLAADVNLEPFRNWVGTTHSLVVDRYGVVMLSFDPNLMLHALPGAAVSKLDEAARTRLYGRTDIPEIEIRPWGSGRFPGLSVLAERAEPFIMRTTSGGGLGLAVLQSVPEAVEYSDQRSVLFVAAGTIGSLLALLALAAAEYLRALAGREAEFRRLAELSPDLVVRYDGAGRIRYFNDKLADFLGVAKSDVLGRHIEQFDAADRYKPIEQARRRVMSTGTSEDVELHLRMTDGGFLAHLVHLAPERNDAGAIGGVVAFGRDITAVKRLEELASEKYRRQLSEAQRIAHVGSWELDSASGNAAWSDEVYRIFERDPRQFRMSHEGILSVVHPDDRERVEQTFEDSLRSGLPWTIDHRLLMADGRVKHVRVRGETAYGEDGKPVSSFGTVQDITDEIEAARQLGQAHIRLSELLRHLEDVREEERKRVSDDLHEELGQTLSSLKMGISALGLEFRDERSAPMRARLPNLMALLDRAIDGLRRSVTDLRPTILNAGIADALKWLLQQFEDASGADCRFRLSEETVTLSDTAATAVFRIVQGALRNVAQHANATRIDIVVARDGDNWLFEVRDDGCGFDPDALPGKSFGLRGMRERARMVGGSVDIESAFAKGTTIAVRIPATAPAVPAA